MKKENEFIIYFQISESKGNLFIIGGGTSKSGYLLSFISLFCPFFSIDFSLCSLFFSIDSLFISVLFSIKTIFFQ